MREAKNSYSVSLVGLGKMGLGYDFKGDRFAGTAKSHFGALLAIENIQNLNLVELNKPNLAQFSDFSTIDSYDFQAFSQSTQIYDLLIIATPTNSHLDVIRQLLRSHTFNCAIIEKPCGISLVEYEEITELLTAKKLLWHVNFFRSFLPNTLQAVTSMSNLGEKPIRAIVTGYGDLLNIFSHFIHLLTLFTDDLGSIMDSQLIDFSSAELTFQTGFAVSLDNIGGAKRDYPILTIIYPTVSLEFKSNGQIIEISKNISGDLVKVFSLPNLDRYQELATREYLRRFDLGLREDCWRVGKVHEIINAVVSLYD
jgi:hypothetical protein